MESVTISSLKISITGSCWQYVGLREAEGQEMVSASLPGRCLGVNCGSKKTRLSRAWSGRLDANTRPQIWQYLEIRRNMFVSFIVRGAYCDKRYRDVVGWLAVGWLVSFVNYRG